MGWELGSAPRLELISPEPGEIECVPFIFSGATPSDGIRGRLEYAGPTVVVGIAPPWEKYVVRDADDRPRAFVVGRPSGPAIAQSGPPAGSAGTQDGPHYTWPACVIGADDLARLHAWRREGREIEARLRIDSAYKPGVRSFVVQAYLHGRTDAVVAVGAHHDCQGAIGMPVAADSPGGCDNASGVAAVIELARHYRESGPATSLRFLTYGGEEWNLTGSRHYVRLLQETGELGRLVAKVNVDQAANGEMLRVHAAGHAQTVRGQLDVEATARCLIAELGVERAAEVIWHVPPTPGSDHWPYFLAGVPVFYSLWDPIPHYHRAGDTAAACVRDDKYELNIALVKSMIDALST